MYTRLSLLIVIAAMCLSGVLVRCVEGYQHPETTRYYSDRGVYTGKSEKRGSITKFYDRRGKFIGKGETR